YRRLLRGPRHLRHHLWLHRESAAHPYRPAADQPPHPRHHALLAARRRAGRHCLHLRAARHVDRTAFLGRSGTADLRLPFFVQIEPSSGFPPTRDLNRTMAPTIIGPARRSLAATAAAALAVATVTMMSLASPAAAQQVVVVVNGDPITAIDIAQRTK